MNYFDNIQKLVAGWEPRIINLVDAIVMQELCISGQIEGDDKKDAGSLKNGGP